jgi:nucleoside 2-deoxyribosyltransferase
MKPSYKTTVPLKPILIDRIYLAGPLEGRTAGEKFGWRDYAAGSLKKAKIISYIPGDDTTKNDERTITAMDLMMIDKSDAVLVNLSCLGEKLPTNTGTIAEIGYAYALGKMIVAFSTTTWMRDNRFLKGMCTAIFMKAPKVAKKDPIIPCDYSQHIVYVDSPLVEAVQYVAGFNQRLRTTRVI